MSLDTFTLAYIECALWSSNDESDDNGGEPLDANYDIDDIADETLEEMIEDCNDFRTKNCLLLARCNLCEERQGHNFWLNRNRHGAGFQDDGCDDLQKLSAAYGSVDLYVGDDGKIHS